MNHQEVSLRKLFPSDRLPLAELANNKKIWDNLRDYFPHPYTIKDADAFIAMTQKEHPQTTFAINHKNGFVGVIGLIVR